jgi:DNA invertase Pin-like site-specific DNA recombinase
MLVHAYSRFSDPKQKAGDSLRRQQQQAAEFCKRRGWKLSDLRFNDEGRSAFKADKQRKLDEFLKAVDDGRVKRGEVLLVESVDRLSRKGIRQTQTLVNRILDAGVSIAILTPIEKVYSPGTTDNDIGFAVELAAFAYQAACYSENLSYRVKQVYSRQRASVARSEGGRISAVGPAWLKWDGKQWKAKPEAVKTIRFMFAQTIAGVGRKLLTQQLNERFPPLMERKTRKGWHVVNVAEILTSRKVLGEAYSTIAKETFPGLYPAIIDLETWNAAQVAIASRRSVRGRPTQRINILAGLLNHAIDGSTCSIYSVCKKLPKGQRRDVRRYQSYDANRSMPGAARETYDVERLEEMLFQFLPVLDLTQRADGRRDNLEADRLAIVADIAELQSQIKNRAAAAAVLAGPLVDLQERLETVDRQLAELPRETAAPTKRYREQLAALRRGTSEERLLVKERLRRIVRAVWMLPVKMGTIRSAPLRLVLEIHFTNGEIRRGVEVDGELIQSAAAKSLREQVQGGTVFNAAWYGKAARAITRKTR